MVVDRRVVLAFVAMVVGAGQCAAAPVRVAFDWHGGGGVQMPARVHIRAVRVVGNSVRSLPVEADASTDGGVIELGEGVWMVEASAPGFWNQGMEVSSPPRTTAAVRLSLWPAATLRGEVVAGDGEVLPSSLQVRLSAASSDSGGAAGTAMVNAQGEPAPRNAELNCPIRDGGWSCVGPAGVFDLRVEAAGYVPRYTWDVKLGGSDGTELGRVDLRRGISVSGRAVRKDGSRPPERCRATLKADSELRTGPDAEPDGVPANEPVLVGALSSGGDFQFAGVQAGRHVLEVDCNGASGFRALTVQTDGETRIDPPVLLEEQTLEVGITPKLDPMGRPWKLTVEATTPRLRRIADRVMLGGDASWKRCGLMAGYYRVMVSSSDGTEWLERNFDLGKQSGPLLLRAQSVAVKGRVTLGEQPVRARLLFSNHAGGEPVTLKSDAEGRFAGLLPIAADARETSWSVEAHTAQPESTRRIASVTVPTVAAGMSASLDLELPLIAVRGRVIGEDGKPEHSMEVKFQDSLGRRITTSTDDGGNFEMAELPAGKYTAVAESEDGASDRIPFDVLDGSERKLTLIVHPSKRVVFEVESDQGPVADATVQVWIEPGVPRSFARTDQNGRFHVTLPRETTEVGLTVGAPGYAVKLVRAGIPNSSDAAAAAIEVKLGTSGGTLELNFEPEEGTLSEGTQLYVAHNGAIQEARTIGGWGTSQAGTNGDGPAVVENIEPGNYALCTIADPSELAVVWMGTLPPDRCRRGTVQNGKTLTLDPVTPGTVANGADSAR